jgi:hypothetical protein
MLGLFNLWAKHLIPRAVHDSVRFGLLKPTEPSNLKFEKIKPNRTKNRFKPNQFGLVKFGFFALKPGNLILSYKNRKLFISACYINDHNCHLYFRIIRMIACNYISV